MPAQETWELVGWSFIPLALGAAMLFLALQVAKRWRWRALASLAAALLLAYWLVMVFVAAYPTIDQTTTRSRCLAPDGTEVECSPDFPEAYRNQD
jgi:amino acid permease